MKSPNRNIKQSQTTVQFLLGPIKIKDGLFIGDQFAAKDIEFIISNKVTHVINTVSKSIPNLYERFGIQYLSVHWTQKQQNIFDKKNNAINAIFQFIEEAMQMGQSCLIHSMYGKSRSCAVLVAYMMKKYNWSLNKCLEYVNAKKEGLEIRNNYLAQMQELEKRMMAESKLSLSWNQIKNQEDLILANTFYNAKKLEPGPISGQKRNGKKRVAFAQKLVYRPQHMAATHTSGFHPVAKTPAVKLRSILKGDNESEKQQDQMSLSKPSTEVETKDDRFVSTINGNIVHVTVNNFITTDKKPQNTPSKIYNTRPFSSDGKDKEKRGYHPTSKIHPSDSNTSTNFKNPYESKLSGKLTSSIASRRKKDEPKALMMIYDRPISAKVNDDKKKGVKPGHLGEKLGHHGNDLMVTNFSKKRYPSSNARDDPQKWK